MKIGFYTLGCKVNQYETQAMEHLFREKGCGIGSFEETCDGYIINTCSVTAVADKKNRAMIRRCRRENPEAVIGVCGCYSQHAPEAIRELGVDVIGGSANRAEFVDMMLAAMETRQHQESLDNALRRRSFEVLPAGGLEERTRAMLKVQDGCVNFCTYCIIPYTRGPVRSAPLETAVEQAKELAQRGYREIVVTGIEIASWGVDLPGKPPVTELIEAVCAAVPELRVRLDCDGGILRQTETAPQSVSPVPSVHAVRLRQRACADEAEIRHGPLFAKRGITEGRFPRLRRYHGYDCGLPRRNGRGFRAEPGLYPSVRLCGYAYFSLFPPAGHAGGQDARAAQQQRQRSPKPDGDCDGGGNEHCLPGGVGRLGAAGAL